MKLLEKIEGKKLYTYATAFYFLLGFLALGILIKIVLLLNEILTVLKG
jgi:hypothetical protein